MSDVKKLFSFLKKLRSRITVKANEQPVLMTVALLLLANIAVILLGAWIALLLDGENYGNYIYAVVNAGKWLIIPNSITTIENFRVVVLAVCITVIGMILFTGTIIAIVTNGIRTYLFNKAEAKGRLDLSDHYVILNYNSKVVEILIDLMFNNEHNTVLILSDKTKEEINEELQSRFSHLSKKPATKLNLIVRKGHPLSASDLTDIAIGQARNILIMDRDDKVEGGTEINPSDLYALKVLLHVTEFIKDEGQSCHVGMEVESYHTVEIIRSLCSSIEHLRCRDISIFSYNKKLGQLLALSILCPPITNLYMELLSFRGCEFYGIDPVPMEEYLSEYTESVPVITDGGRTYVLAEDAGTLHRKRVQPFFTGRRLHIASNPLASHAHIFIIGKNQKTDYMLESLRHVEAAGQITVRYFEKDDRAGFVQALRGQAEGKKIAVILSDDTVEEKDFDTNVYMTLIALHREFGDQIDFQIITEILNPANQQSVESFHVSNIIVSNRIVSFLITQTMTKARSGNFYENVFSLSTETDNSFNIWVQTVDRLLLPGQNLRFTSYAELVHAIYFGSGEKIMPLGFVRADRNEFFCEGMDDPRDITLQPDDRIAFVHYT